LRRVFLRQGMRLYEVLDDQNQGGDTIDSKLLNAQVAIENALSNTTIKDAMALFGYDEAKL
jgi:hypothetical protein